MIEVQAPTVFNMSLIRAIAKTLLLTGLVFGISACQSLGYYSQSVIGHSKLMLARTKIERALPNVDKNTADKLRLSQELKQFAITQLDLPSNSSYSTYVDLQRPYPVWVVVAAPEFSLTPKQWCYPVIGCAAYRGYFKQKSAQLYASKLASKGLETYVSGAPAYSTLGWFSDPLLPSMMNGGDAIFAETLFHELAHQKLYVKGKSDLNEAFASLVGEQGALRWLKQHKPDALESYLRLVDARNDFSVLLKEFKDKLSVAYTGEFSETEKRVRKEQLLRQLNGRYVQLKQQRWQGRGYYDNWLLTPINNARLAAFSTYHELIPKLQAMFEQCGSDFTRFYRQIEKLQDINEQSLECL